MGDPDRSFWLLASALPGPGCSRYLRSEPVDLNLSMSVCVSALQVNKEIFKKLRNKRGLRELACPLQHVREKVPFVYQNKTSSDTESAGALIAQPSELR